MTNKLQNTQIGYFFAISATILWSGNFIIARGLSENIPPISLAFYRWIVAVVVFFPFAWKSFYEQRNALQSNIIYLSITSLLGITTFNTLIYLAGQTTTAMNLSLISITFPIFIIIITRIFMGESITKSKLIGILLVIIGVLLLLTAGDISHIRHISFTIGDMWMLIAAIIFAAYSVLLKCKPPQISISTLQLSTFILGLIFLLPFFIWEYATTSAVEFDIKIISSIFYVGIFASLLAFIFWNKAIATIGPSKAGMIYYTLPLFSGFLAYIFLQESIGSIHFFSALLIVPGIVIANH
ncbi:DMT family transporter [Candidatus Uabimicrobium sp. HlEnr_7]|uniref:DMT family transporter n=1 Tax=Candidatus Uabimicrobium helgolandensis TaxID=3095367 RepID=UPI003557AB48